jgi:hypothetical protein
MVLMICHRARPIEGCWYLATIFFHAAVSTRAGTDLEVAPGGTA